MEKYICASCKETFISEWSDNEAQIEYKRRFPDSEPVADAEVVCEECYNKMKDYFGWPEIQA